MAAFAVHTGRAALALDAVTTVTRATVQVLVEEAAVGAAVAVTRCNPDQAHEIRLLSISDDVRAANLDTR